MNMDNELRLISCLLTANEAEQKSFEDKAYPLTLFVDRRNEYEWVQDFKRQYDSYPSRKAFEARFKLKLSSVDDPLPSVVQPLVDYFFYRQMKQTYAAVQKRIDAGADMGTVFADFTNEVAGFQSLTTSYSDVHAGIDDSSLDRYRELVRSAKSTHRLDTPWPTMNKLIKFFRPKETLVIAARLSMGKTWIVLSLANYWAECGFKVLVISKEMGVETIQDRSDAIRFGLNYSDMREGTMKPSEWARWLKLKRLSKKYPDKFKLILTGDETLKGTSLEDVHAVIKRYKPDVTIIDGAYLLRMPGLSKGNSEVERLSSISQGCKRLSKFTNSFLVSVVQMNRDAENKLGITKGGVTTIYGADAWAQDADWVMDFSGQRGGNTREVTLLKGRESGLGSITISFTVIPAPSFKEIAGASSNGSPKPRNEDEADGPLFKKAH